MYYRNLFIEIRNYQVYIFVVQGCLLLYDMLYVLGFEDRNVLFENEIRRFCY